MGESPGCSDAGWQNPSPLGVVERGETAGTRHMAVIGSRVIPASRMADNAQTGVNRSHSPNPVSNPSMLRAFFARR